MSTLDRDAQLSTLSNASYMESPPKQIGDWKMVGDPKQTASGFFGVAYVNDSTNQVAVVYRGTDKLLSGDTGADLAFKTGEWHPQFEDAAAFTATIKEAIAKTPAFQGYQLLTTGHSLGGGIAQLMGKMFGLNGASFDAPGADLIAGRERFAAAITRHAGGSIQDIGDTFLNYTAQGSAISSVGSHIGDERSLVNLSDPSLAPFLIGILSAWTGGAALGLLGLGGVANITDTHLMEGIERAIHIAAGLEKALGDGNLKMSTMSWSQATGQTWNGTGTEPQVVTFADAANKVKAYVNHSGDTWTVSTPNLSTVITLTKSAEGTPPTCTVHQPGKAAYSCTMIQVEDQVSLNTDANNDGRTDVIEVDTLITAEFTDVATDTNADGILDSRELISSDGTINDLSSVDDIMAAEYVLSDLNDFGLIDTDFYIGFTDWSSFELLSFDSATYLPQIDLGFDLNLDPIGAYYDSQPLVTDAAPSIADKTPVILDAANCGMTVAGLASLDANQDGKLSGAESVSLRLWSDLDEDGVLDGPELASVSSEIKSVDYGYYTQGNARYLDSASADGNYVALRGAIYWTGNGSDWGFDASMTHLIGGDYADALSVLAIQQIFPNASLTNIVSGGGNDSVFGGNSADIIWGGSGNDWLFGLAAADSVYGETGDDSLVGQAGNDVLYGGDGDDVLYGLDGEDDINQHLAAGESDDDWLFGGAGRDILAGGLGNDYLDGGAGVDFMFGGQGDDTYIVNSVNDNPYESDGTGSGYDTVFSSANCSLAHGVEELRLIDGIDINGTGNALDNLIVANCRDNILDGVTGKDTMIGGVGNDTYYVDDVGDQVVEQSGEGVDTVQSSIDYSLGANVESLVLLDFSKPEKGMVGGVEVLVYGYPKRYELDYMQGDAVPDYWGTCALTSIANMLSQAVGPTTEGEIVQLAIENGWAITNAPDTQRTPYELGGSDYMQQQAILDSKHIRTGLLEGYNAQAVANLIQSGRGVILGVNAGQLWNDPTPALNGGAVNHVVTITGAAYEATSHLLKGFYIADSGRGLVTDMTRYLSAEEFQAAANVSSAYAIYTLEPLKLRDESIAGHGNGLDNLIAGNRGDNWLTGEGGNDKLDGCDGSDTLTGGVGGDTLDGGAGNDSLLGGAGNDSYYVDVAGDSVTEFVAEGTDTVNASVSWILGANLENLTLTGAAALEAVGNGLANVLVGNTGANRLDGGAGADSMSGGLGNDAYYVDNPTDVVLENAGEGIDSVNAVFSWTLGANIENLTLAEGAAYGATGNELANVLVGNGNANLIYGGAGADTMAGGTGDDTYDVDNASDVVTELTGEGMDTVSASVSCTLGANVERLFLNGSAAITGTGNGGANAITGNSVTNFLYGNGGNDTLDGGTSWDYMYGWSGDDSYYVDNLSDYVFEYSGFGTDTVYASISWTLGSSELENLTLTGSGALNGTGNDYANVLAGNGGTNVLRGNGGNDRLDGGAGADTMYGGIGDDTYYVNHINDLVAESAGEGTDTVYSSVSRTLSPNDENLTLTGFAAINGTGNGVGNVLVGNGGANILDGLLGADSMSGGLGDDIYDVRDVGDTVTENPNEGTDTVRASVSWTMSANLERLTLMGTAANATGNQMDNILTGNNAPNTLRGGLGNDTYYAGAGDVVVENAGEGSDTVYSPDSWTLGLEVENVTLTGTWAVNATGNSLANVLVGNSAANVLNGLGGADSMSGGGGNDIYYADNVGDVVTETTGGGTDAVYASVSFTLGAEVENLTLTGVAAINATGNGFNNALFGNSGANVLDGRSGNDTMSGGSGDDSYYVDSPADLVSESAGGGIDTVYSAVTLTLGANIENLTLTGTTQINANGNYLDNVLTGNSAVNVLAGGVGNDTYYVTSGDSVSEYSGQGLDTVYSPVSWTLGGEVENLVLTGTDAINATGNGLGNILTGNAAANVLSGGGGNDTYYVDRASDTVIENSGQGVDTVCSSISWTAGANVENVTLLGTQALNATGNGLDNVLKGNVATNVLVGGLGNDTYYVDNFDDLMVENSGEGTDTVCASISWTLASHFENVTLTGSAAINATGNSFDNVITGNGAVNLLMGGLGNDTYYVDQAGDAVIENAGEGVDTVCSWTSWTLGANIENVTLIGTAAVNATGNEIDNVLRGNSAGNVLRGGLGNDAYYVDQAGDAVIESVNEGVDTVYSSISWALGNDLENLTLTGTAAVTATGNGQDNTLAGNSAANMLSGGLGNDSYYVGGGDSVAENFDGGVDTVYSSVSRTLEANVENIELSGASLINATGNELDNVLTGNSAANALVGCLGSDTYRLGLGGGTDLIRENDATVGNSDSGLFLGGIACDQIWFRRSGDNLEASVIGTGNSLTVENWYLGSQYRVEQFCTTDGARILLDGQVENLVQAMAAFSPPAAGTTTLPPAYQTALGSVLAANWQ